MRPVRAHTIVFAACVALAACALEPPPDHATLTQDALGAGGMPPEAWRAGQPLAGTVTHTWLASFNEPALNALVVDALAHNADLKAAAAQVEQAEAQLKIAGATLWPQITFLASAGGKSGTGSSVRGELFSASWELDLWGRLRYGKRAAAEVHASAQADYHYAQLSLAALVAKGWFVAAESAEQHALATEILAASEKLLELAKLREQVGSGNHLDVALADSNVQSYRDSLRQLVLAREQALRALELLAGRYPAAALEASTLLPALPAASPAGVPSELLERRPDVIAAERRVAAAFSRVGEAKAARLPAVTLGLGTSWINSDLFLLQNRDNPRTGYNAGVTLPLFTGGSLAAQVELRTAEQKQAVAQYAALGLKAFGEVESALASEATLGDRQALIEQLVVDNAEVRKLSEKRYRVGSGDLRDVLNDDLRLYSSRVQLVNLRAQRLAQRVNLHLALGDDYVSSEPAIASGSE